MAKIIILIEGVGLIYEKNDGENPSENHWKILFPFNNQHRVNFIWKQEGHVNNEPLALEGGEINISVENATSEHAVGDMYDRFFDVKSVHTNGVKLKPNWEKSGIFLSIPNARLSCVKETLSTFIITEQGVQIPNNQATSIGYSATAEIVLDANGSVKVEATKDNKPYFLKTFAGQDLTIKFDNDCPSSPPTEITDFENVYNVIEDAMSSERRFSLERVEKTPLKKSDSMPLNDILKNALNNASSNSSTFETNLAPFEEGVPCHLVKSSEPLQLQDN